MAQVVNDVGCDMSKDWIDVAILPDGFRLRVSNDRAGWAELIRCLAGRAIRAIGVEATGGYERGLILALLKAGLPVRRVNPYRLRRFAQGLGIKAKNDRIDALAIARFVATLELHPVVYDPTVEQLSELTLARQQLSDDLVRTQNQAQHARDARVRRLATRRIKQLKADIALLEKHLAETVASDADLARKDRLLRSVPGVGPVLSYVLLAWMPELGRITRSQVASLLGVAPFDHDSGLFRGMRCIAGGRKRVRNIAYMAAMVAARYNPALASMYQRLKQKGKKPKVAIVAVMRKLITILNAMLRDGREWAAPLQCDGEPGVAPGRA